MHRHFDPDGNPQFFDDPTPSITASLHRRPESACPIQAKPASATTSAATATSTSTPGLAKSWQIRGVWSLKFAWEVYNVTNSVRFDPAFIGSGLTGGNLGVASALLTRSTPYAVQPALRLLKFASNQTAPDEPTLFRRLRVSRRSTTQFPHNSYSPLSPPLKDARILPSVGFVPSRSSPALNALPLLLMVLGIFFVAYRYYSALLASRAFALSDRNITPAHRFNDGHNYVPSPHWVVFGHHFAAIAGAGPLVGPTLAAQFGFAPGFCGSLSARSSPAACRISPFWSARFATKAGRWRTSRRTEISPFRGLGGHDRRAVHPAIIAMAGLGIVVVNALAESPWGVFTIGMTIPIALGHGLVDVQSAPGRDARARPSPSSASSLFAAALFAGHWVAGSSLVAHASRFLQHQIVSADVRLRLCRPAFCRCGCCSSRATISRPI